MSSALGSLSRVPLDKVAGPIPTCRGDVGVGGGFDSGSGSVADVIGSLPLCIKCHLPLEEKYVVRVRGRFWHSRCALCAVCGCSLSEFCFVLEGRLLCRQDYHRLYATKCATCKQPMLSHELCMRTGAEVHHVSCFVCSVCREPLVVGVEYARDPTTGAPVCKPDCLRRSAPSIAAAPLAAQLPSATAVSCKRGRTTLSAEQRAQLQRVFEENPRPSKKAREALAEEFGLSVRVVQVWFQNQRAREKKLSAASVASASPSANTVTTTAAAPATPNGMSSSASPSTTTKPSQYRPGIKKAQLFHWKDSTNSQQWQ
ncbi:LIM/homeobox protein Lhx3 [Taenia crassiceps]|uniref:LIM/homeobox protein Lhx3 n=1 Tax=Taenia crassiceps TaxID=6207 RepID=A0ABR4Q4U9_9CEST